MDINSQRQRPWRPGWLISKTKALLLEELEAMRRKFVDLEVGRKKAGDCLPAVSIEQAQMPRETGCVSITDELTGLFNRSHLDEMLEVEIYRCQRYGRHLSLVMMEFEGLEECIGEVGQAGVDAMLKALARKLKTELRKSDATGRYDKGKFLIILPETDAGRAVKVIECIRLEFTRMPEVEHIFRGFGLKMSAGVAEYPQVAATADGIKAMAECALFYARMQGGNRTVSISDFEARLAGNLDAEDISEVGDLADYTEGIYLAKSGSPTNLARITELWGKIMGLRKN